MANEEKEGDIDVMKIDPKVRLFVLALNEAHMQGLDNCMDIFKQIFDKVDNEYQSTINEIWINRKNPYNISDTIKNIFFYNIFDNLQDKAIKLRNVCNNDRVIKKVPLDTQVLERILQAKLYVDTYQSLENMGIKINDDINKNYSINIQKNYNNNINIDEKYINLSHAIRFIRLLEDIESKFESVAKFESVEPNPLLDPKYTTQSENESGSNSISLNQIDFSDPFEMIYQIIREVFYLEGQITKFQLYIMNYYRKNKEEMKTLFFSYDLDKFNFLNLLNSIIQFINKMIIIINDKMIEIINETNFQLTIYDRDKYQYIEKDIVLLEKIIENIENDTDAKKLLKNIHKLSGKLNKFDTEIRKKLIEYDGELKNIKTYSNNVAIKRIFNEIKEDTFLSEYEKFHFLNKTIKSIKSELSDSKSNDDEFIKWLDKFIKNNNSIEEKKELHNRDEQTSSNPLHPYLIS